MKRLINKLTSLTQTIGNDVKDILARLDKLESGTTSTSASVKDRIHIYRRTQTYNFVNPENQSYAWSGEQIKYTFPMPPEFVGKFCEVFINGNIDARVPSMSSELTLYSQNTTGTDEVLVIAYEDSEHITHELMTHGL